MVTLLGVFPNDINVALELGVNMEEVVIKVNITSGDLRPVHAKVRTSITDSS